MSAVWLFTFALIPIIWLIVSLGIFKIPGDKACPIALLITILLSIFVWKFSFIDSITATFEGIALALWPIMIVIIAAVFTYNLSLHTGSMEIIKKMMMEITTDKRILVLILAWGFGGFLEAIAGFGTAVAIPASIMAGLGFNPLFAAIICLIANTTPTAFGAIGLPVTTLAQVTNLNVNQLSYAVSIQLFLFIIIVPIILVMITGKSVKAIKGVFLITLISGISFALPQVLVAKYIGAELPAILGSIISMISTIIFAKLFCKKTFNKDDSLTTKKKVWAWIPFILVFLFIFFTSSLFPFINEKLSLVKTSIKIYSGNGAKPYKFLWLATPGTLIIIATYIGGFIQGAKFKEISNVLIKTFKQMGKSSVTIMAIVALAKVWVIAV